MLMPPLAQPARNVLGHDRPPRWDGGTAASGSLILEIGLRVIACSAEFAFVQAALSAYWRDTSRVSLLLVVVSELWSLALLLIARPTSRRDMHPLVVLALPFVFGYVALLATGPGHRVLPEWLCVSIQGAGLLWALYAKISLGRSFGLLPANRGVVDSGAYRWVRHPMYLGYLLNHVGFLLASFHLRNLLVFVVLYAIQIYRIFREERLLSLSADYRDYCRRVRYRLLVGVF